MQSSLTSRVLVACSEPPEAVDPPAATDRCWPMAEALAAGHDVILAVPAVTGLYHRRFAVVYYNSRNLWLVARDSDVVVCDAAVLAGNPQLLKAGKPLAVDLSGAPLPGESGAAAHEIGRVLGTADFFICASEEERQAWLPALKDAGRVNQYTLEGDSGLRRTIEVARPDRIQALTDFCAVPRYASDRGSGLSLASLPVEEKSAKGIAYYWRAFLYLLRTGGPGAVWSRGSLAIKRRISGRR
ncbi:MAG: hypothetical protein M1455_00220 [Actinobacteria bacterium]|nr:hypothetical protein [Actinomycetota bacterium]